MSTPDSRPPEPKWKNRPMVSFKARLTELESAFGEPHGRDLDSNGMGLMDCWLVSWPCGLEVVFRAFQTFPDGSEATPDEHRWVEISANECDVEHLATHLSFEMREISPWEPYPGSPPKRWKVLRQDDNGNQVEVARASSACEAKAVLARMEELKHKQLYWIEAS